jgi:hypothetical protein
MGGKGCGFRLVGEAFGHACSGGTKAENESLQSPCPMTTFTTLFWETRIAAALFAAGENKILWQFEFA